LYESADVAVEETATLAGDGREGRGGEVVIDAAFLPCEVHRSVTVMAHHIIQLHELLG
jgi:hypothetical protein